MRYYIPFSLLLQHTLVLNLEYSNLTSTNTDSSGNRSKLKCSNCGKEFENLGDLQRHTTVEHIQKGELPSGSKDALRGENRRTTRRPFSNLIVEVRQ